MELLPCGHTANAAESRACAHLTVDSPPDFVAWFTGKGLSYDRLCETCSKLDDPRSALVTVCEGCQERIDDYSELLGWCGQPEIRHQDGELRGTSTTTACPVEPVNEHCVAALPGGWLVLTDDGLVEVDETGARLVAPVSINAEPRGGEKGRPHRLSLHTSPDGRHAAVVTDYGRYGVVLDLLNGSPVLSLDRGDYRNEQTPFPVAFLGSGGDARVVVATEWNRLDAYDLATGQSLTDRETTWNGKGPRPEHYLDYFHGALVADPSEKWLLDDGWVWSPAGIPTVLDIGAWLDGDVFTTEHGKHLSARHYAWDQPAAWVDHRTVAIQRIGHDDRAMVDGVQLYDAVTGERVGAFAGPAGRMWGRDGLLFVGAAAGLEVWVTESGARIGVVAGFTPIAHNPRTGRFAELSAGQLRVWTPAGTLT